MFIISLNTENSDLIANVSYLPHSFMFISALPPPPALSLAPVCIPIH